MWSDDLDNKMKEVTEGYHPAYDDKAWDKMEVLLDKHLPQEKKRRRFILLLLPLLLVGTGIFLISQKRAKNRIGEEKNTVVRPASKEKQIEAQTSVTIPSEATGSEPEVITKQSAVTEPVKEKNRITAIKPQKQIIADDAGSVGNKKVKQIASLKKELKQQTSSGETEAKDNSKGQEISVTAQQAPEQNITTAGIDKHNVSNSTIPVPVDTETSLTPIAKAAAEENKPPDSSKNKDALSAPKPQKQKSSPGGKLSLNFSAGPDISSVGIDNPGKWNFQYGIGVIYAVSKRLSIRTGFFAGRKRYSADSTEYHANYYPPKLERIDANCLVYEIPVNLVYNFSAAKKNNWFIAGGLSSYLMKKETYDYFYKNAWGQSQYYSHTYNNENSHIFSVINISGGYQHHFTDRLSIMAEPYVRIPLSGIGSGRVKLNSGGVLFSIGFKPFLKKK
jgi:hypothetical protein